MNTVEQSRAHIGQSALISPRQFALQYGVYVSLLVLLIAARFLTPKIYTGESFQLILKLASQLGLVAIGQTLVLLVAGLDLSVGGVIVLTSVVIAKVTAEQDALIPAAILIALAFGALIGFANGLLITKRNVPPFVATLGMLILILGAQIAYTQGVPSGFVPRGLNVVNQSLGFLPVPLVLWIVFNLVIVFVLRMTPYGRQVYAVGNNREAARLSGINVDRILISVYILCSLMAVVAGIVLSGYAGFIDRYLGRGLDLDSIAAAVVGGTAFTGGRGGLLGTMAGVLIVQFLASMSLFLGLNVDAQLIVKGSVIVAAVALYSVAGRKQ